MKNSSKKYKYIIALILVSVLSLIGVSYSAWTDTLSIKGKFTTGNFNIEFAEGKHVVVDLVSIEGSNVSVKENIRRFNMNKDDKSIKLNIKDELLQKLEEQGNMLRIGYPLRTTEDSHVKNIKTIKPNFNNPDDSISIIPSNIKITVEGKLIDLDEKVNKEDYRINFNVYKQISTEKNKNFAIHYIEAKDINANPKEINIEYKDLVSSLAKGAKIDQNDPVITSKLEAEYFLEIPIVVEQYNAD